MSSTTNVQNLLSNVFRPTFTYDTTYSNYTSKLELINIDTVSANAVTVYAVNVGDASGNVYVGTLAGNANSNLASKLSISNTFVGTSAGAGASNVSNSVFLGYGAGAGTVSSSNSISIGSFSVAGGNSNIYIGAGTGITTGSNNIFLGTGLNPATTSNTLLIGNGASNMAIVGALSGTSNRIGINYSSLTAFPSTSSNNALDVNGLTRIGGPTGNGQLGVNIQPGTYTLDVNGSMRVQDGVGNLTLSNGNLALGNGNLTLSNGNLTLSNGGIVSANKIASSSGFSSVNGQISIGTNGTSNIGVWKPGIVIVTATVPYVGNAGGLLTVGGIYMVHYTSLSTSYFVYLMSVYPPVRVPGGTTDPFQASIGASGSNITLYNGDITSTQFTYSITYLPSS